MSKRELSPREVEAVSGALSLGEAYQAGKKVVRVVRSVLRTTSGKPQA